jgi:hypothetical protein
VADSNQTLAPIDAGPETHYVQAMVQQPRAALIPDGGHIPAVPEPAGWVLLLSGLAVVACIARRRAGMALM